MRNAIFDRSLRLGLLAGGVVVLLSQPRLGAAAETPMLSQFQAAAGQPLRFTVTGTTGQVFSIERSADLAHWDLLLFTNAASGQVPFVEAVLTNRSMLYYRARMDTPATEVFVTNYHGWAGSYVLRNGQVEAIVVPAVGRVMQFRFVGEADGPFWENRNLDGQAPAADTWSKSAGSFGGDKSWPAPQDAWNWPPPRGFDSLAAAVEVGDGYLTMRHPVDATYGIAAVRRIELHPTQPLMRIVTTFDKRALGSVGNADVGVWVITQLKDPTRAFLDVPSASGFSKGYRVFGSGTPPSLLQSGGLVSLSRDRNTAWKIGNDGGTLIWVGPAWALRLESPRVPGVALAGYPDNGCSAEIYTNPGAAAYVELELLGPKQKLPVGSQTWRANLYRLYRREKADAQEEALRVLNQP